MFNLWCPTALTVRNGCSVVSTQARLEGGNELCVEWLMRGRTPSVTVSVGQVTSKL